METRKVHYTSPTYPNFAACDYYRQLELTKVIADVTCRRCLNLIVPKRSLEELQALAVETKVGD